MWLELLCWFAATLAIGTVVAFGACALGTLVLNACCMQDDEHD